MTKSAYSRPKDLPDFSFPPLVEVGIGVQFQPPTGYQQIYAGDVWELFKAEFSTVQEQPPLPPTFETFGLSAQSMTMPFNIISGAVHDRFWFVEPSGNELIQFQQDRLLHNWRKLGNNEYPRFKYMIDKFEAEVLLFESFINSLASQKLNINQCEISFVNQIPVEDFTGAEAAKWLNFLRFDTILPNDFSLTMREIVNNSSGQSQGRLMIDAGSAIEGNGKKVIRFNLTVRGAPMDTHLNSALEFLAIGHNLIVNRFADLTTDLAHKAWGRK